MRYQWIKLLQTLFLVSSSLFSLTVHASFIESAMGAAVVNDATAIFYNPAALVLLKNPQFILMNSSSYFRSTFTGKFIQTRTDFTQSGSALTETHYQLPSFYLAIPTKKRMTIGLGVISNMFNRDIDGDSLLRYAQSSNKIENIDIIPALNFKVNKYLSLGAGINFSYARFLLLPIIGFPTLDIPDTQSRNECDGTGIGGHIGLLFQPRKSTMIGFNYRSAMTYRLRGTSLFESNPPVFSDHYGFTIWTPARSILSINQMLTPSFGMIGTVQRIQWSIFDKINIHGIATQIGSQPAILNANVLYHLRDTWLATVGVHYRITPKWIVRIASVYNQSASNGNFQVSNGDTIIVGATMGYDLSKNITVDAGYAHAFVQEQDIQISNQRSQINGVTHGFLNVFSLKLTFNIFSNSR